MEGQDWGDFWGRAIRVGTRRGSAGLGREGRRGGSIGQASTLERRLVGGSGSRRSLGKVSGQE